MVHDIRLVHHIPLTKRDEFFKLISQQLASDIKPGLDQLGLFMQGMSLDTYRFTAFHTICPLRIGMTCVKLKPESITSMHSAGGRSGCANRVPYGIIAVAAEKMN